MEFITIPVESRESLGSSNARRLRRQEAVPAMLYGMGRPNIALTVQRSELERFLRTGSHLVELAMGGRARPAILRELQTDATTDAILHVDFARVDAETPVETEIRVVWKGRAPGEGEGGVFLTAQDTVAISARPRDLPREYVHDISGVHLDEFVTIADLEKRPGVEFLEPATTVLATCHVPRAAASTTPEAAAEDAAAGEAVAGGEAAPAQ